MTDISQKFTEADVQKINAAMVEGELITSDHIYLDLRMFKDYNLGVINSFVVERDDAFGKRVHESLVKGMDAYQRRYFDTVCEHFPGLGITEEEFNTRFNDPKYANLIARLSPATDALNLLKVNLILNSNHSMVKGHYQKIPLDKFKYARKFDAITLYINTYPLRLNKASCDVIGEFFTENFHVDVKILFSDPTRLFDVAVPRYEEFYFYRFDNVIENPIVMKRLEAFEFLKKKILCCPIAGADKAGLHKVEEMGPLLAHAKARYDLYTDFYWIPKSRTAAKPHLFDNDEEPTTT